MSYLDNFHYTISREEHSKKLVFLHGLMGAGGNWKRIARAFKEDYQVLTYDQRGHGRSFQPEAGYQPEDFADDLEQILDELGWDNVYLVGHSMGGRGAMNFAHRFPDRVEKLVVEDISPAISAATVNKIETLLAIVPTPFSSRDTARRFFESGEFERKLPPGFDAGVMGGYFYANMKEAENGTAGWRFSKAAILKTLRFGLESDRWHEAVEMEVPTLVVRGENSIDLSEENFALFQEASPRIEGVQIPDCGHWVHFDQPELFIETVRAFFSAH